jgi:hypothetical protein
MDEMKPLATIGALGNGVEMRVSFRDKSNVLGKIKNLYDAKINKLLTPSIVHGNISLTSFILY